MEGQASERRYAPRAAIAVCSTGQHPQPISPMEIAVQTRCRRGHWTWEDGNYCTVCGVQLTPTQGVPH